MGEPKFHFQERVGPWREVFLWLPTRMFDGHWRWLSKAWKAVYQTKPYLSGPMIDQWVFTDLHPGDTP